MQIHETELLTCIEGYLKRLRLKSHGSRALLQDLAEASQITAEGKRSTGRA